MSGCQHGNVSNNRLLCSSININIHNEDIYIHSVRSTEDRKQPWSMVHSSACEIKWLSVNIFKLRLKKIEGCMQSWIILESSATAFFIWTRGEPVQIRWRTNTMKNKYKARGASMLPSLWRALSCHRHGWGPALYHDHHLPSRWLGEQEVSPENDVMAAQSQAAAASAWRGDFLACRWESSVKITSFRLRGSGLTSSLLVTRPSPPWTSSGVAPGTRMRTWPSTSGTPRTEGALERA